MLGVLVALGRGALLWVLVLIGYPPDSGHSVDRLVGGLKFPIKTVTNPGAAGQPPER